VTRNHKVVRNPGRHRSRDAGPVRFDDPIARWNFGPNAKE